MYKIGDVVLTPFPFTDLSGHKVRPALILGVQSRGDDITVCFISSVVQKKISEFDILVNEKNEDFKKTGLKIASVIKTTKIATLDKVVVLGKIGEIDLAGMKKVKKILKTYLEL